VNLVIIIIMIGVALIDGKLWKMMAAQRDHQQKVEAILSEIRDSLGQKQTSRP
jgi:hypothetical protein